MRRTRIWIGTLLCFLLFSSPLQAHEDCCEPGSSSATEREEVEKLVQLYHYAIEFSPEVLNKGKAPQSIPYLQASLFGPQFMGKKVYLNSHFWNMVGSWIEIYHAEVLSDCPTCLLPSPEEIKTQAQGQPARGWLRRLIVDPASRSAQHLTLEAVDLGAQLGKVAFVLKITSEVAETVLSKVMGGAGVHLFCTAIDAAILFGTRSIQTSLRTPLLGAQTRAGALRSAARVAYLSRVFRRARKRVQIEVGPLTGDESLIDVIDQQGPNRWWGRVNGGKRKVFLNQLQSRYQKAKSDLDNLDEQIEGLKGSRKRQGLLKKRESLAKKLYPIVRLYQKVYLGRRYKRFLWLKARRRGYSGHLSGSTWMDRVTQDPTLWILSVQQNVLNRASLGPEASSPQLNHLEEHRASLPDYEVDAIQDFLAGEFLERLRSFSSASEATAEGIAPLLNDISFIFDSDQPRKQRYLYVLMLESGVNSFLYEWMRTLTEKKFNVLPSSRESLQLQIQTRWQLGQVAYLMSEFSDFLRVAATTKDPQLLQKRKHESMEYFLLLLSSFFQGGQVLDAQSLEDVRAHNARMKDNLNQLKATRPWQDKRVRLPRPLNWRAPLCDKLHRRAQ